MEYIRFSNEEVFYGKKNLLQSQLELLSTIKRQRNFHKLRKDELLLKIELKRKVEETKTALDILEKSLPKTQFKEQEQEEKQIAKSMVFPQEELQVKQKEFTLERELEEIKSKLSKLK